MRIAVAITMQAGTKSFVQEASATIPDPPAQEIRSKDSGIRYEAITDPDPRDVARAAHVREVCRALLEALLHHNA